MQRTGLLARLVAWDVHEMDHDQLTYKTELSCNFSEAS